MLVQRILGYWVSDGGIGRAGISHATRAKAKYSIPGKQSAAVRTRTRASIHANWMYVQNSRSTNLVACRRGSAHKYAAEEARREGNKKRVGAQRVDGEPTLYFPAIFFVSLFFSFPSVFVLNAVSRDRREIESEKELRDTHAEHCAPADRVAAFSQPIDLGAARQYVLTLWFFGLDTVGGGETENSRMIH